MKNSFLTSIVVLITLISNAQQLEWAKSFGGSEADESLAITTDNFGNVYSTGYFFGNVDFDPGPDSHILESESTGGTENTFVSKLNNNGDFVWAVNFNSTSYSIGEDIVVDTLGDVYVTGYFYDTIDINPGVDTFNLIAEGGHIDIFVVKLNSEGEFIWGKSFGGTDSDQASAIKLTSEGDIIIVGQFKNTVDFDPHPINEHNLTSTGSADAFILKLDQDGNFIWAKSFGGNHYDQISSVATDINNNIFLTGHFIDVADFDPGPGAYNLTSTGSSDIFVMKLTPNADLVWAKSIGGADMDRATSIEVDNLNNFYICGYFTNSIDIDTESGVLTLDSEGGRDALLIKYHESGTIIWARSFGSPANDIARSVTIDPLDNPIVYGYFEDAIDLNPGDEDLIFTSNGDQDIFLVTLTPSGILQWGTSYGGIDHDSAYDLTTDQYGNIYTTGSYWELANFDFSPNTTNLSGIGYDAFIQKISPEYAGVDHLEIKEFKLYPNPTNGSFNLDLSQFTEDIELSIYNGYGQLVHSETISHSKEELNIKTSLASGVYMIHVTGDNTQTQQKLIIQ